MEGKASNSTTKSVVVAMLLDWRLREESSVPTMVVVASAAAIVEAIVPNINRLMANRQGLAMARACG